ncbi:ABC transporter ATP-binding protein [Mesoterricola sediminis]|uniref:ABC transporter ATP-binding protein n=1 Tax=Mesoterricola sediminis TaxID=2927980 RepID=A0AA48H4J6_9BACT|nr:ABC transporter ATP-binding protein [Mesoterricola sediminis]BDU77326.1 ABC transporter ATP-binding protein [Mesoterricola sediminis]
MITLAGVSKAFHPGTPAEHWALRDVDLALEPGQVTVLTGPSGAGKTTLLLLAGCLARPTSGRVLFRGEPISHLGERFLAETRNRHIGFVFQQFNLLPGRSALQNVLLPAVPLGTPWRARLDRAQGLLETLQVGHRAHAEASRLSSGEQQRVAIARALMNDPEILLADEPTANLDAAAAERFVDLLARLHTRGRTLLLSSHDPRLVASGVAHRTLRLADGRLEEA